MNQKAEIEKLKAKKEEDKLSIRKLEDDNLSLKYQLASFRKKDESQTKQIQEMKRRIK